MFAIKFTRFNQPARIPQFACVRSDGSSLTGPSNPEGRGLLTISFSKLASNFRSLWPQSAGPNYSRPTMQAD